MILLPNSLTFVQVELTGEQCDPCIVDAVPRLQCRFSQTLDAQNVHEWSMTHDLHRGTLFSFFFGENKQDDDVFILPVRCGPSKAAGQAIESLRPTAPMG